MSQFLTLDGQRFDAISGHGSDRTAAYSSGYAAGFAAWPRAVTAPACHADRQRASYVTGACHGAAHARRLQRR